MPVVGSIRGFGWGREPILRPNIGFTISPAINGRTYWNLYDDGDFTIVGKTTNPVAYTITFTANVDIGIIGIGGGGGNNVSGASRGSGAGSFVGYFSANTTTSYKIFAGSQGSTSGSSREGAGGGAASGLLTRSNNPIIIAGGGGGSGGYDAHFNTISNGNTVAGEGYDVSYFGNVSSNIGGNSSVGVRVTTTGGVTGVTNDAFSGGFGGLAPPDNVSYHSGGSGGGGGGWWGGESTVAGDHASFGGANGVSNTLLGNIKIYPSSGTSAPVIEPGYLIGRYTAAASPAGDINYGAPGSPGALTLFWKRFTPKGFEASGGIERDVLLFGNVLVKEHVFTTSGTFTVSNIAYQTPIEYLIVGGGGGGGSGGVDVVEGGGGGFGGQVIYGILYPESGDTTITIGTGGAPGVGGAGAAGSNSIIVTPSGNTITAAGGAGGAVNVNNAPGRAGQLFPTVNGLFCDNTQTYAGGGAQSPTISRYYLPTATVPGQAYTFASIGYTEPVAWVTATPKSTGKNGGIGSTRTPGQVYDASLANGLENTGSGGAGGWDTTNAIVVSNTKGGANNTYVNNPGSGSSGIVILRYVGEQTWDAKDTPLPYYVADPFPGARVITYPGYFGESVVWFDRVVPTSDQVITNSLGPYPAGTGPTYTQYPSYAFADGAIQTYISFQILGYFKATQTGTYTFSLGTDDASFMWLGEHALDLPLSTSLAFIKNPGTHGLVTKTATVDLVAGCYYPVRVQYGNNAGGGGLYFSWTDPSGVSNSDLTTDFFVNKNTGAF